MTDPKNTNSSDEALRRAEELLARRASEQGRAAKIDRAVKQVEKSSPAGQFFQNIAIIASTITMARKTLGKIGEGWDWVKDNILAPVGKIPLIGPVIASPFRTWKSLYDRFAFPYEGETAWMATKDIIRNAPTAFMNAITNPFRKEKRALPEDTRERIFSPSRSAVACLTTAFALASPLSTIPFVNQVIPEPVSDASYALFYEPPMDAVRMAFNAALHGGEIRVENLYLNGANEIKADDNLWSVKGCEERPDCNPEDAVYFRIRPSLMHQAWSLSTKAVPFIPDDVAGVIPNVPSKCEVKSYGSRWRVFKWMQSYPVMLDVKCAALNGMQGATVPSPDGYVLSAANTPAPAPQMQQLNTAALAPVAP